MRARYGASIVSSNSDLGNAWAAAVLSRECCMEYSFTLDRVILARVFIRVSDYTTRVKAIANWSHYLKWLNVLWRSYYCVWQLYWAEKCHEIKSRCHVLLFCYVKCLFSWYYTWIRFGGLEIQWRFYVGIIRISHNLHPGVHGEFSRHFYMFSERHTNLNSLATRMFVQQLHLPDIKATSSLCITCPFWGKSTDDRWILLTKDP